MRLDKYLADAGMGTRSEAKKMITAGRVTDLITDKVRKDLFPAGLQVTGLKRLSMGPLTLDPALRPGEYRPLTKEEHPALELEAIMLNVNRNHNPELMAACKTLRDYAEYTDCVRRYKDEYETLEEAVERAVDECIEEGVLDDFLRRHRAEVISVSIYEYIDDEKFLKMQRADAYEEGRADGISVGKLEMLYDLVKENMLSLAEAAKKANQTEEKFEAGMKAYFAERESA